MLSYAGVGSALILLSGFFALRADQFATFGNLVNILETNSVLLVLAIGLTFVLLVGGFDLSIGGMLALSGVGLSVLLGEGVPPLVAVFLVIVAAGTLALGTNGVLVACFGLSFFVATLGMASIFRGAALVYTEGASQQLYDQSLIRSLGGGRVADVPIPVIIAAAVLVVAMLVTRYTGFGRMIYLVGGNPEAARLAGINVVGIRLAVYTACGALAGLAGVMQAGRLAAAAPDVGLGIELTAGAAVLLGGTSFVGGSGGMFGTLLGTLFLGVLANGLTVSGTSSFLEGIVAGAALVFAVGLDRLRRAKGLPAVLKLRNRRERSV